MTGKTLRQQLQQQIEFLPDDLVREIADFITVVLARYTSAGTLYDGEEIGWQYFAVQSFFREPDEVTYILADAIEVYRSDSV